MICFIPHAILACKHYTAPYWGVSAPQPPMEMRYISLRHIIARYKVPVIQRSLRTLVEARGSRGGGFHFRLSSADQSVSSARCRHSARIHARVRSSRAPFGELPVWASSPT